MAGSNVPKLGSSLNVPLAYLYVRACADVREECTLYGGMNGEPGYVHLETAWERVGLCV